MVDITGLNSFHFSVKAQALERVDSVQELDGLNRRLQHAQMPYYLLGGGNNVLFAEPEYQGTIIQLVNKALSYQVQGTQVELRVGAGMDWDELVAFTVAQGWYGLERLSGIPGTAGASPVQNIGAYGAEVKQTLFSADIYSMQHAGLSTYPAEALALGYRTSILKRGEPLAGRGVVTQLTFHLSTLPASRGSYGHRLNVHEDATPAQIRAEVLRQRASKLPDLKEYGSAGSFFKNPTLSQARYEHLRASYPQLQGFPGADGGVKVSAGFLIEQCGWKGYREGRVQVYPKQALVLVNCGGATGAEVLALARKIQEDVLEKTGVSLELEVNVVSSHQ